MRPLTVFPLSALLLMTSVNAAMYKWTDAAGNVQYGEHPPPGTQAEHIKAQRAPKSAAPAPSLQQQIEALDKRKQKEAEQAAKAAEEKRNAENRKINCTNARRNLEQLNLGGHRLTRMPDGSYQRLDEKQKQAAIAKNKKAVDEFCD